MDKSRSTTVGDSICIQLRPLVWAEESGDDYRCFSANSALGKFTYGTDTTNVSYHQGPDTEEDHTDEESAKLAAEATYRRLAEASLAPMFDLIPSSDC